MVLDPAEWRNCAAAMLAHPAAIGRRRDDDKPWIRVQRR
jgi:hypothetical protein